MNRTNTKLPGFGCCSPRSLTNLGVGSWWFMNLEAAWEQMTLFNLQLKNWVPTVSLSPACRSTPAAQSMEMCGDFRRGVCSREGLGRWIMWSYRKVRLLTTENWQLVISGFNVADQAWSWAQREREIDRLKGLKYNWMNGERERYWGDGQKYTESYR